MVEEVWRENKVRDLVYSEDVCHVLPLKLIHSQNRDYLGWNGTETGIYTVKSGHWLRSHLPDNIPIQPAPENNLLKSDIWKLTISLKIKHFLWWILTRSIATRDELTRRNIINNAVCKLCLTEPESADHIYTCG